MAASACAATDTVAPGVADFKVLLRHLGARAPGADVDVADGSGRTHTKTRDHLDAGDPWFLFSGVAVGPFRVDVRLTDVPDPIVRQGHRDAGGQPLTVVVDTRPDALHVVLATPCADVDACLPQVETVACAAQARCADGRCALTCVDEEAERLICARDTECPGPGSALATLSGDWSCPGGTCRIVLE